jgi:outer membrane protein assembly factor BamE
MIAAHYRRPRPVTPDSESSPMPATVRAAFFLMLVVAVVGSAGGCVYRPDIQQGNLLEVKDIEQVTTGMTRSQVRYLLGTPMLADPFDPQRWDYIYTLRRGRERQIDRAHFVVRFDGDKVSRVEKLDLPEPVRVDRNVKRARELLDEAQAEPARPAPPTSTMPEQPQPETTTPGQDQPQPETSAPGG